VVNWFRDVLSGLNYLYSKHIVHRDLKLDNLALLADNIKIVDFGSAIKLDHTMKLPFAIMQERGGNEAHLAPEILNERPGPGKVLNYTKQPVWAAGVLAYELAGHTNPFSSNIDQRGYDVSSLPCLSSTYCQGSVNVQTLPRSMTTLVESMLEFDSSKRPTLNEALQRVSNFL
jgi:serine/threonine protein kinase